MTFQELGASLGASAPGELFIDLTRLDVCAPVWVTLSLVRGFACGKSMENFIGEFCKIL